MDVSGSAPLHSDDEGELRDTASQRNAPGVDVDDLVPFIGEILHDAPPELAAASRYDDALAGKLSLRLPKGAVCSEG